MSLALRNYSKNNRRKSRPKTRDFTRSNATIRSVPRAQQMFPDVLRTKLRNVINTSFPALGGAITAWGIIANGLNAPVAATTTGANALSFTSTTNIVGIGALLGVPAVNAAYAYSRYRIYGSSITVKLQSNSTAVVAGNFIVFPTSQGFLLGNVNNYNLATQGEYPYAKLKHVGPSTFNEGVTIKNSITTEKIFGLRYPSSMETSTFSAAGGASPANPWQWILAWDPDTGNNSAIDLLIEIDYDAEFFERVPMIATTI